jgi:predicted phage-related endonuclease
MGLALDTGYLVALEDGRNLKVHKFDRDEEMVNMIARMTSEFWTRVEAGRLALELGEDYEQYAPPPDGTEAYAEFLNKKFANPEENTIVSTPEIDEFILQYKVKNTEISILEDEKREAANFIKDYMGNNTTIQSEEGKVTWRPNAKGVRIFRIG